MDFCTAKRIIETLTYKPSYRFEVIDFNARIEGAIAVRVTFTAPNYSAKFAPDYPEQVTPNPTFPLLILDCDCPDELLYRLITEVLIPLEEHEIREALRAHRGGEWHAPFHPHNHDAMHAWAARRGTPIERDVHFGALGQL
jgi:hypothetical protein